MASGNPGVRPVVGLDDNRVGGTAREVDQNVLAAFLDIDNIARDVLPRADVVLDDREDIVSFVGVHVKDSEGNHIAVFIQTAVAEEHVICRECCIGFFSDH